MNLNLQERLQECGVSFSALSKSEKVKLLSRWTRGFADLAECARHGGTSPSVSLDHAADTQYARFRNVEFFVLPDDPSGMPSFLCEAEALPDLRDLVSDTITRCDELVVLGSDFRWSAVFVNHGSPKLVGRYFQERAE